MLLRFCLAITGVENFISQGDLFSQFRGDRICPMFQSRIVKHNLKGAATHKIRLGSNNAYCFLVIL